MATRIRSEECRATPRIFCVVKKLSLANEKVIRATPRNQGNTPALINELDKNFLSIEK